MKEFNLKEGKDYTVDNERIIELKTFDEVFKDV